MTPCGLIRAVARLAGAKSIQGELLLPNQSMSQPQPLSALHSRSNQRWSQKLPIRAPLARSPADGRGVISVVTSSAGPTARRKWNGKADLVSHSDPTPGG